MLYARTIDFNNENDSNAAVFRLTPENSRVLDVGRGCGQSGFNVQNQTIFAD